MKRLLSILFILLCFCQLVKAQQVIDTTTFQLNQYLYTVPGNPYPVINAAAIRDMDTTGFVHMMWYAHGDGVTLDDAALINAVHDADTSAVHGIIFDAGHTYLFTNRNTDTIHHDMDFFATGATFKSKDLANTYSFLELRSGADLGFNQYNIRWKGGLINGNESYQKYPLNPRGDIYAPALGSNSHNGFQEGHGQLVNFTRFANVTFVDVQVINSVVDGLVAEGSKVVIFYNCTATGGAKLKYNEVQDQGTYFKSTRIGMGATYVYNCILDYGSIGFQASYPENADTMDTHITTVVAYSSFRHNVQNSIHFEDSYRNFLYRDTIIKDTAKYAWGGSIHFSNKTHIASVRECEITNDRLNFNQATGIDAGGLALVDRCNFYSTYDNTDTATNNLTMFIEGNPTDVINCNFTGKVTDVQAEVRYVKKCTFNDFGALALRGTSAADSCTFNNGVRPSSNRTGGAVLSTCTYNNVSNPNTFGTPSVATWADAFKSYIYIQNSTPAYYANINAYMSIFKTLLLQYISATPTGSLKKLTAGTITGTLQAGQKKLTLTAP